jgi:cell division protein FtsB
MSSARSASAGRRPQRARRSGASGRKNVIRWDRLARVSLLVVMAVIVASYIGPATKYVRAWKLSHATHTELTQLQTEHQQLKSRLKQLHDPRLIELEARKTGMARPDQKVYVIKGLPRSADSGK